MINQTEQTLYRLDNLNAEQRRISYQTSTGKILEKGSDDAVLFNREIYIDDKINVYEGLKTQLEKTTAANNISDSSMAEIKNVLDSAKSELLKASTATTTDEGKKSIALGLEGMKSNLLNLVNTRVGGEYLFSGSDSSIKPFSEDSNGKVTYEGDNLLRKVASEFGSYSQRGINGIDMMFYTTNTATKNSSTLEFEDTQKIFDENGLEWKLNAAKDTLVQYDYNGNITTNVKAPVTNDGATPAKYSVDVGTADGTKFEAKTNIFDLFDNVINALNKVDSVGNPITDIQSNDIISKGITFMTDAYDAANVAHAELGARNKSFELALDSVTSKLSQYNILSQKIGAVDLGKVAVEAKALELTYTALYSTISKTNQLSLVNFLN